MLEGCSWLLGIRQETNASWPAESRVSQATQVYAKSESKMTVSILNCNDVFLVGTDVECDRYYDICSHQHGSLKVVGSPILNDIGHHHDRYEEDRCLKHVKIQRHGLRKHPTQNYHHGEDQESDLEHSADKFPDRPVNLLAGGGYDPDVLREIPTAGMITRPRNALLTPIVRANRSILPTREEAHRTRQRVEMAKARLAMTGSREG